jgi:hypothetical protein
VTHHILFYDYVPDILERRAPHRPAHLEAITSAKAKGRIVMAGPVGDPIHGAVIVFSGLSASEVDAWAAEDPYVRAGLVSGRRVELWTVV